jgi:hypothetical protein
VADGVRPSLGMSTAASDTPLPPSIGVLTMTVPTTKVTASVSSAKTSPRMPLTRKTMAPTSRPKALATSAAAGSVHRKGQLKRDISVALV